MLGTIADLAARHGGSVEGDGSCRIHGVAPVTSATAGDLAVLTHPRYTSDLQDCPAAALLVDVALARRARGRHTLWIHEHPRSALAQVLAELGPPTFESADRSAEPRVHDSAVIDPRAHIAEEVCIGALSVVDAGATVGPGTVLGPRCFVGESARLGAGCHLDPASMVLAGCVLGDRVRLGPGAVVGAEGFGFVPAEGGEPARKVPQRGIAVLEDDVELGALTVVDRATLGQTVVRRGAKIDNLVQVGHNCDVGAGVIMAGQCGLAGSVRVGQGSLLGGQVGVGDHVDVGAGARLAARSGVTGDVPAGQTVAGYPALPHSEWLRAWGWLRRAAARRRRQDP